MDIKYFTKQRYGGLKVCSHCQYSRYTSQGVASARRIMDVNHADNPL